jgi:hypothetical protein
VGHKPGWGWARASGFVCFSAIEVLHPCKKKKKEKKVSHPKYIA